MTDDKLENLIKPLVNIYSDLELELIKDIAVRLNTYDGIKGTLKWNIDKLEELGGFNKDNLKLLSKYSKKSQSEIKKILKSVGYNISTLSDKKNIITDEILKKSPSSLYNSVAIKNIVNETIKETNTIMETIQTKAIESAKKEYMQILTNSYIKVSSGLYSYDKVIKEALNKLAKEGITGATYKNGTKLSLESTVRRDILTKCHQLSAEIEIQKARDSGTNLVYVTQHLGARIRTKYTKEDYEAHCEWQGKVYMLDGSNEKYDNFYEKTGYGELLGLCGVNCRHHVFATDEGKTHLALYDEEENEKAYLLSQEQRSYERKEREYKKKIEVTKILDDKVELKKIRQKKKLFDSRYDSFLKENNLQRDYNREYVDKDIVKIDNSVLGSGKTIDSFVEKHEKMKLLGNIVNLNHEKAISLLEKYERKIVDSDIENAIIILDDGSYYQCFGKGTNVYPYYDLAQDEKLAERKILYMTHNHLKSETNYSFDGDDRRTWSNHEELLVLRHIDPYYKSQFSRLDKYVDAPISYEDLFDMPIEIVQHNINVEYAKERNYGYKRRKNNI